MFDTIVSAGTTVVLTLICIVLKQIAASIKENRIDLKEHIKEDTRRFEIVNDSLTQIKVAVASNGKFKLQ